MLISFKDLVKNRCILSRKIICKYALEMLEFLRQGLFFFSRLWSIVFPPIMYAYFLIHMWSTVVLSVLYICHLPDWGEILWKKVEKGLPQTIQVGSILFSMTECIGIYDRSISLWKVACMPALLNSLLKWLSRASRLGSNHQESDTTDQSAPISLPASLRFLGRHFDENVYFFFFLFIQPKLKSMVRGVARRGIPNPKLGCRLRASGICPIPCAYPLPTSLLRAFVKMAFLVARTSALKDPCVRLYQEWPLRSSVFQSHLKSTFGSKHLKLWVLLPGFYQVVYYLKPGSKNHSSETLVFTTWLLTTAIRFHYPTLVYGGVYNWPEPFLMQPEP